jgi:tetratricopeptide (TPR) repeat protein
MQRIRHATKRHGKLLIVVVAILAIGLVGSFAVWGSGDYSTGDQSEMTTADQIAYYEQYLAENEPAEGSEIDFSTATNMANLYMTLHDLYYQGYSDVAATDSDAALAYYNDSVTAATKAAAYFQTQLDTAPDTLNDYGRAQILSDQAQAISYTGDYDQAQTLYDEALALSPECYDAASNYLSFLYGTQGLDAAQAYADSYLALVGEDSEYYAQIEQEIEYYAFLDELNNTTEEVTDETATDETASGDTASDETATADTATDETQN